MTTHEKILKLLDDGQWHHALELNQAVGYKWPARLSEVRRKEGILIIDRPTGKFKEYKLLKSEQEIENKKKRIEEFNETFRWIEKEIEIEDEIKTEQLALGI